MWRFDCIFHVVHSPNMYHLHALPCLSCLALASLLHRNRAPSRIHTQKGPEKRFVIYCHPHAHVHITTVRCLPSWASLLFLLMFTTLRYRPPSLPFDHRDHHPRSSKTPPTTPHRSKTNCDACGLHESHMAIPWCLPAWLKASPCHSQPCVPVAFHASHSTTP